MTDPTAAIAAQLSNIENATGRTIAQWIATIEASGLSKHGQVVSFLKEQHGFTHGNANTLAHRARQHASGPPGDAELLATQYQGAKAALRPIYDEIVVTAQSLGPDVAVAVKKTGVSLRRAKQFALVEAPSASRIRLSFNMRDVGPSSRLKATTGMCTHTVDLNEPGDVDDEVAGWLRAAYEQAGPKR